MATTLAPLAFTAGLACESPGRTRLNRCAWLRRLRVFPGKVDTGFPKGNATTLESRALSGHDQCDFIVNLIGKRSSTSDGSPCDDHHLNGWRWEGASWPAPPVS